MRSTTLRGLAATLLLVTLVASEALSVSLISDRCACGKVVGACCHLRRQQQHAMKPGASCHLGKAAAPRCSMERSDSLPPALESQREAADRPGLWQARPGEILLAPAGWVAEASPIHPSSPLFDPPVPPPKSSRRA